ncbi:MULTISPECIES: hypothetical protein [unclassified Streptomyces]|uniref:hypothetical protein n=1 Tax=unclassified Streptomyces TaxID=2593676 RepID=UPI003664AB51
MHPTELAKIDRAKSPLLAADHGPELIAEALRRSPHILKVDDVEPGDKAVWFRDAGGVGHTLSLTSVEPVPDDGPQGEAYAWDAVAAAIGNHPDFVDAKLAREGFGPDSLETITAITRTDDEYTLKLTVTPRPLADSVEEPTGPVADILRAVGQLRSRNANDPDRVVFDTSADLLEHLAGTWDQQDDQTRLRAVGLALALIL